MILSHNIRKNRKFRLSHIKLTQPIKARLAEKLKE